VRRLPKGAALVRFVSDDIIIAIILIMAPRSIENTVEQMRKGATIHFTDLANVCRHYFGEPRIVGSHHVYKMPWAGDPRVNIQNEKGKAKAYQVRQVLAAIDRLAIEALIRRKVAEKKEDKAKKK
jgi:hypothetical protein